MVEPNITALFCTLLLSIALGAIVGVEREKSHKPAGLRTHMLVCMGACLVTIVSSNYFGMDPARIAAGIITGIGFLGAGTIIASRGNVHGLTTAASIWIVGAIGLAVGAGAYALSIVTAVLVFLILEFGKFEKHIRK